MDKISKVIVELLKQTSIYCATEDCRFNNGCECALRNVLVLEGKCNEYERRPDPSEG